MHGSSGKALKADAGILLVPLKCGNVKIPPFVRGPVTIRSVALVNAQIVLVPHGGSW